eukprot:EG_transcript_1475
MRSFISTVITSSRPAEEASSSPAPPAPQQECPPSSEDSSPRQALEGMSSASEAPAVPTDDRRAAASEWQAAVRARALPLLQRGQWATLPGCLRAVAADLRGPPTAALNALLAVVSRPQFSRLCDSPLARPAPGAGIEWDVETYGRAAAHRADLSQWPEVEAHLQAVRDRGGVPDPSVLRRLLQGYTTEGNAEAALRVFRQAQGQGCPLSRANLLAVAELGAAAGCFAEVEAALRALRAAGLTAHPHFWRRLLDVLLGAGQLPLCLQLLTECAAGTGLRLGPTWRVRLAQAAVKDWCPGRLSSMVAAVQAGCTDSLPKLVHDFLRAAEETAAEAKPAMKAEAFAELARLSGAPGLKGVAGPSGTQAPTGFSAVRAGTPSTPRPCLPDGPPADQRLPARP